MINPDRIVLLDDSRRRGDRSDLALVEALFELDVLAAEWRKRNASVKRVTTTETSR